MNVASLIPKEQDMSQSSKRNISINPIPEIESRTIVWEPKRPALVPLVPIPHDTDDVKSWCIDSLKMELQKLEPMSNNIESWLLSMDKNEVVEVCQGI